MTYCVKSDLVERFGTVELSQLTDITGGAIPIDTVITKSCEEASSLIDGYVSSAYIVPLNPVPDIVRKWACDIARKFLWKDRAKPDSVVAVTYEETIKRLQDVAKGALQLGSTTTGAENQRSEGIVAVESSDMVFTDDVLSRM